MALSESGSETPSPNEVSNSVSTPEPVEAQAGPHKGPEQLTDAQAELYQTRLRQLVSGNRKMLLEDKNASRPRRFL
jgi:hypothetical protein